MDTELVRRVARGLRYRSLGRLVGRVVEVHDLDRVEDAVRLAFGPDLPEGCRLAGPELRYREGAVARHGILDLFFTAPRALLACNLPPGVSLLRDLGYLPGETTVPQQRVRDDPKSLEVLEECLAEGRTWLLLFLEGGGPGGRASLRDPMECQPRRFRVVDACVTNARAAWLWKHFYW
jgi:hypothetical protein